MDEITPVIRNLARRLIDLEAGIGVGDVSLATIACGRLQASLVKLVGAEGFRSLLMRALSRAKAEDPSIEGVIVGPDGSLVGMPGPGLAHDDGAVVLAHLLGLMATFIGIPLMLRITGEAWPDELRCGGDPPSEEGS